MVIVRSQFRGILIVGGIWFASLGSAGLRSASPSGERLVVAQSPTFGVGHTPTPDHLKTIDIEVTPDGKGLAPGSGTAAAGKDVYTRRCETCHGPTGKEGPQDVLVGGQGSLNTDRPLKTVGSYWPYATTLWDYIRRAMPFDHPGTLTSDELYAVTAYVLFMNGIVGDQDALNQTTLPQVKMPNRNGFVADPRPDVPLKKK
jgi:cytochrome c